MNLVLDGVPYTVKVTPFEFNTETRYNVSYNGNEFVFAYDTNMGQYASIGEGSESIPDNLEILVAEKLESFR